MKIINRIRDHATEICEQKFPTREEAGHFIRARIAELNDPGEWKHSIGETFLRIQSKVGYALRLNQNGRIGVDCGMKRYEGEEENSWMSNPRYIATKVMVKIAEALESGQETFDPNDYVSNIGTMVAEQVLQVIQPKNINEMIERQVERMLMEDENCSTDENWHKRVDALMADMDEEDSRMRDAYRGVMEIIQKTRTFRILQEMIIRDNLPNIPTRHLVLLAYTRSSIKSLMGESFPSG